MLLAVSDTPFIWEMAGRAASSFFAWLGTTPPGFVVGNILGIILTLLVTHIVRGARGDMSEGTKKDLEIGLTVYAIVFLILFVPIFVYHLLIKVPSEIRTRAENVRVPDMRQWIPLPPLWDGTAPAIRRPIAAGQVSIVPAYGNLRERCIVLSQEIGEFVEHRYDQQTKYD